MTKDSIKQMIKISFVTSLALGLFSTLTENQTVKAESNSVTRIQGDNRFETASLISEESYASSDTVIIANAREFADALTGVPLAYQHQAPILLAQGNGLREATINEINRLGATEAIILGGEVAISNEVEESLQALGLSTRRLAGDNRFETAEAIADELLEFTPSDTAVLVDGFEFADAMSIAPIAAQEGMPIYLTRTNSLSTDDLSTYDSTYIIGGENAVSSTVANQLNNVRRLAGDNRYETNVEVLDYFDVESNHLFIATGLDFVDALTGSVLAANESTGVGLVRRDVNNDLKNYFDNRFFDTFTILGGEVAVPSAVYSTLSDYLESKEVKNETVLENEIPFETIERENEDLPLGETQVVQEGQDGYDEVTYSITYTNGVETARKEISRLTVDPIEEIVEVGTLKLTDPRTALNGLTVEITDISYSEGEYFDTFSITYTETNNTNERIDQDSFKLYLEDGSNITQYGFFGRLWPEQTATRSYTFELSKSEKPSVLEYGDVFFNTSPDGKNATWNVSSVILE